MILIAASEESLKYAETLQQIQSEGMKTIFKWFPGTNS